MPPSVVPFIVGKLPEFRRRYPDIQLTITSSDNLVDLVDEGLDCTIRFGQLADSSYVARHLGYLPMAVCASPNYLAEYGTPQNLDDLAQHQAIHYFSGKYRKVLAWKLGKKGKIETVKPLSAMLVNESNLLLQSLLAGLGIGYLPKPFVANYLENGQLTEILTDYQIPSRPLWLIYPQREFVPKRLAVFWEWLSEIFAVYR